MMSTHFRRSRRLAAGLLAAGMLLSACGGSQTDDVAAPPAPDETADPADPAAEPVDATADGADCSAGELTIAAAEQEGLPAEVADMRRFLLDAALRCDEQLFFTAVDEGDTSYDFGGAQDPIGFWRELEERGARPYAALVEMLLTTPAVADGEVAYVWPRVATGRPEDTTEEAWGELDSFYDAEEIERLRASDTGYLGWRVGIRPDGTWAFFVQGD